MQVEKIHVLRRHLSGIDMDAPPHTRHHRGTVGVVNFRATRIIAFLIISLAVIATAVTCVLAVWEVLEQDYAWRALGSLGIISAATAIFVSLNEGFGPAVRQDPSPPPAPTADN